MPTRLSEAEIVERLDDLGGWTRNGAEIRKTFTMASFPASIAFVTHVAFLAEAAGHHPDIDIRYNRVTLTLTTHDAGGLSDNDFSLAERIDELL